MTSPKDPQTKVYSHLNGTHSELFDRLAVSELCKGWCVYRDASEWKNYREMFAEEAWVWTTWSGPKTIDDFIQVSKEGKANGDWIMHRECGTLVDLNPSTSRAIGKMKATITQRFSHHGIPYDIDCDCNFTFFCFKNANGEWKAKFKKLFYHKDKLVLVGVPKEEDLRVLGGLFTDKALERFPVGYRYLGVAQESLGHKIDARLPTDEGELWGKMYAAMEDWLAGKDVDLFWE